MTRTAGCSKKDINSDNNCTIKDTFDGLTVQSDSSNNNGNVVFNVEGEKHNMITNSGEIDSYIYEYMSCHVPLVP
jgi:methyltransferase-like protein